MLLWTRAVSSDVARSAHAVVQISQDPSFDTVVLEAPVVATAESDHTVRFFAHGLEPDTIYYYRFVTGSAASDTGRTRTAPAPSANRVVRMAWASCQGMEWGFFGGWRRMIADDESAPPQQRLDFVLHVGDFIYEEGGLSVPDGEHRRLHGSSPFLRDRAGRDRTPLPFPSGGRKAQHGEAAAADLGDYRHLYKSYLDDADLRAARARWPFVCTWDDHEFANNCWQAHTPGEAFQTGRAAANRAWFEYVPAVLTGTVGVEGVEPRAHDFENVAVEDAPFGDQEEPSPDHEPNNLAAIESVTLYRSLRFGKNVDLIVTDSRSYRSDHCVPESWATEYFNGSVPKTPELIEILDAGRTAGGGTPPDEITSGEFTAPNPRRDHPPGTLLGASQRAWFEASLTASDATWKLWANSVPAMTLTLDFDTVPFADTPRVVLTDDAWAGYPSELRSLLHFLRAQGIENVVSLAGDVHMHLAGAVAPEPLGDDREAVLPEFVVGGIASASTFRILRMIARNQDGLAMATVDENDRTRELLNNTLKNGVFSSLVYRTTGSPLLSRLAASGSTNPHLTWVDSNAVGYGIVTAGPETCEIELVTIEAPLEDLAGEPSPVIRRVRFQLQSGEKIPRPVSIQGQPPFPIESI